MTDLPDAASVAIVRDGMVLLIRRARAPWQGLWSLPGGRREPGESIEACATRELREELDVTVAALQPLVRLRLGGEAKFLLEVFATSEFSGDISANDEISDWRWTAPADWAGLEKTPHLSDVLDRAFGLFASP